MDDHEAMDDDARSPHAIRRVRSFVMRQGRTTPAQEQAFAHHWERYGLDFAERYRNLPYIGVLHPDLVPHGL